MKVSRSFEEAANILEQGGVIICPTDTVYGFLADASNKRAVEKIFKIKKRKRSQPIPVFVSGISMARKIAFVDKEQEKFLKKNWPGKVTFILLKKKSAKIYGAGKGTIGLRCPKSRIVLSIIRKVKKPLSQTSVNISGEAPLNNPKEIEELFGKDKRVSLFIDGGKLGVKASKVIDLSQKRIKVLRK